MTTRTMPFLSGAALFVRTDFFKLIGGFDEKLVFYNDDIDFAKRVKEHKKELIYFPTVSIIHHGGLSTNFVPIDSLISGYFGSLHLCQKFYPKLVFKLYLLLMRIFITFKFYYHSIVNKPNSDEWKKKILQLKIRINDEF